MNQAAPNYKLFRAFPRAGNGRIGMGAVRMHSGNKGKKNLIV